MNSTIQLSPDQWNSLSQGEAVAVCVGNSRKVVLLNADHYNRLVSALNLEHDPRDFYPSLAEISPEDWDDLTNYPHAEKL